MVENIEMQKPTYETTDLDENLVELLGEQEVLSFTNGEIKSLKDLNEGTVVLNFILGSWCPMCLKHIAKMVEVFHSLDKHDYNMVIVTTEKMKNLKDSLERVAHKRNLPGMDRVHFISNASRDLLNSFHVRVPVFGFAKPATIVVEELRTAKTISKGVPNEDRINCEVSYWLSRVA